MKIRIFYYIIIFSMLPIIAISQTKTGYLEVMGKVKIEKDPVPKASVKVMDGTNIIIQKYTDNNGKFKMKLPLNKILIMEVGKDGLVTKKIKFDTHVPETDFYWTYNFTVELFMYIEGLNIAPLKQPVTIVKYNKEYDEFEYDEDYTNLMRTKLKPILEQLETLKKQKFNEIMAKADKLCDEGKYEEAIDMYESAIDYDPYNYLPDNKIEICERKRNQSGKIEKEYTRLITSADASFDQQRYKDALSYYKRASSLKPSEEYPKQKIEEINKLLAQQENKKELDAKNKKYNQYITLADKQFNNKQYELAKQNYNKALGIKPAESYPKQKIEEIDNILKQQQEALAQQAQQEELNKKYLDKINEADKNFKNKNYNDAKKLYNEALAIKKDEKYPKDKIAEIDKILADQAAKQKLEKQYQDLITQADKAFNAKDYNNAKSKYSDAANLKPDEKYPKDKIAEIDKILAEQAAKQKLEKQYQDLIAQADKAFNTKDYNNAKSKYSDASKLKPDEKYPKDKIAEIDKILAQQAAIANYKKLKAEADRLYNNKQFEEALAKYKSALEFKPTSQYVKNRINEIEDYLAEQAKAKERAKKREEAYKKAIAEGDKYFTQKDYKNALTAYKRAKDIKPNESYPKQQISKINGLLAQTNPAPAKNKDEEVLKKLNSVNFNDKEATKKYLSELARKYPEGKTVENYDLKNQKIVRIIINKNGIATEYRKVIHDWGGVYYFKNGQSISKTIFTNETGQN